MSEVATKLTEWMHACNFPFSPGDLFDISTHPDCSEVWPSKRRGAEAVDRGNHRPTHRPRLPEGAEEWSHSVRVRTFAERHSTKMSHFHSGAILVPFQRGQWLILKTLSFMLSSLLIRSGKWLPKIDDHWSENSIFFVSFRLINQLSPGSVKKISKSSLNWHQVSFRESAV